MAEFSIEGGSAMLRYFFLKDSMALDSNKKSSPLRPLFTLMNSIAGLLLMICLWKREEPWLLVILIICWLVTYIIYVVCYIHLYFNKIELL